MISGKANCGFLLRLPSMIVVGGKAVCLIGENVFPAMCRFFDTS